MAKKEVTAADEVTTEVTAVSAPTDDDAMEGFEESEITLQTIPILALAQSQTPEVVEGEIEGLKAGVLMNNTTKMPIGSEVELIAFKLWPGRTKFPPRGDNGPIECFSPDGVCGRTYGECAKCGFRDFNLTDRCQDQRYFVVAPASNPNEMYRIIFAKSNFRTGKTLENTLKAECQKNKLPIYGVKFMLSTKRVKNEKANSYYYVFEVKPSGLVEKEMFEELRDKFREVTELRKNSVDEFYAQLEEGKSSEESFPEDELGGESASPAVEEDGAQLL